jgi:hypothetical protein
MGDGEQIAHDIIGVTRLEGDSSAAVGIGLSR